MAKLGKRTRAAREAFAEKHNVTVEEAVALVKNHASAKFDETVEIAVNLGVNPRHADAALPDELLEADPVARRVEG